MSVELMLVLVLLGIFVGVMAGLLGVGGGGILVPMLTSIFIHQGVSPSNVVHLALGTSMACITLTSLSSMRAHHKNGAVMWPLVKVMAVGMIIGTFSATFLTPYLSSKALAIFFAVFMLYVSVQMFTSNKIAAVAKPIHKVELGLVTLLIGGVSALVSIGGGSLTVPYLTWRNIDIKNAIATSAALGFFISMAGTAGYLINGLLHSSAADNSLGEHTLGYIYLPALVLVAMPSFFTAPLGAKLTQRLPIKTLKKGFGVLLLLLSLKMAASFY